MEERGDLPVRAPGGNPPRRPAVPVENSWLCASVIESVAPDGVLPVFSGGTIPGSGHNAPYADIGITAGILVIVGITVLPIRNGACIGEVCPLAGFESLRRVDLLSGGARLGIDIPPSNICRIRSPSTPTPPDQSLDCA